MSQPNVNIVPRHLRRGYVLLGALAAAEAAGVPSVALMHAVAENQTGPAVASREAGLLPEPAFRSASQGALTSTLS